MYILLRKKRIFIFASCLVACVIAVLSVLQITKYVSGRYNDIPTVIIDAGHGGFDGGAVGHDGTVEKDLNLNYSKELKKHLELFGFRVIMTRTTDDGTHNKNDSIRKMKHSDILNRFQVIKDNPNAIFISIHMNKFTTPSTRGYQIFYSPKNNQGKVLAEITTQNLDVYMEPVKKRVPKKCTSSVYLIYNSPNPAILMECGFVSNPEELKLLKDENYMKKMMFILAKSICDYYAGNDVTYKATMEKPSCTVIKES